MVVRGLAVRVFANGPGDLGSIPGRVIPKTQKMVLDASLLNTQHYKVRIKGKVKQSREGVTPFPTPWCSSYRKGSLQVTLDYGHRLYLLTCSSQIISLTKQNQNLNNFKIKVYYSDGIICKGTHNVVVVVVVFSHLSSSQFL